jgi:hypothetical protein
LVKPLRTCFSQKLAIEILSVPEGKETGGVVLVPVPVLAFKTSKMLTFSADPVGPELALPPHAVSPTNKEHTKAKAHG